MADLRVKSAKSLILPTGWIVSFRWISLQNIYKQQSLKMTHNVLLVWNFLQLHFSYCAGWDSSVGIVIHYEQDGPGIESPWRCDFL